jgi:phosphate transport system permease protein
MRVLKPLLANASTRASAISASPAPDAVQKLETTVSHGTTTTAGDRIYRIAITAFALAIPVLLTLIAIEVVSGAWPAFQAAGFEFLTSSEWDVNNGKFGAAAAIYGTIVSSIIALVLATPLAIGAAVFLSEFAPSWIQQPFAFLVDLLAAIPSVVYGLWGIFVLIPLLRSDVMPFLQNTLHLSSTPLFAGPAYGPSMLAAGIILAIMILPYISAVSREVLRAVPRSQREAALALGATRWEVIWNVVLPYAKSGIVGGVILGLGRALGETMAVTMVIGNSPRIAASLFAPGYTLASRIANEFNEATNDLHVSALMATGATLFAIAIVVNMIARYLVSRVRRGVA